MSVPRAVRPDTIFALSSGRPPAAIAVVRISGPQAGEALSRLVGRLPQPRQAALVKVRAPGSGEIIDQALALWFPGPRSETGEDVAEIQLHGGHAVVAATFAALGAIEGLRPAEAGEFTRRAFLNGQLDLTEVEGLADLIGAETEAQRRQALRQLQGQLGRTAEGWRSRLVEALALVEAGIDFSDEADVPDELVRPALAQARQLSEEIDAVLAAPPRGERLREGFVVAIAGPPNAGKSTLLNRLARREAAIVSPFAGTTRDVIEVHLDLDGYPVTLLDTAGIRETGDPVELEGVRRARERAAAADLVLWVVDACAPAEAPAGAWLLRNKSDLAAENPIAPPVMDRSRTGAAREFSLSGATGAGVDDLVRALSAAAGAALAGGAPALITRERHRAILVETAAALRRALATPPERDDLVAEELRLAARALGRLTGRVDVENILDVIFCDFCVGK